MHSYTQIIHKHTNYNVKTRKTNKPKQATTQRKDNRKYQNYYVGRTGKNNNIEIKEQKTTT